MDTDPQRGAHGMFGHIDGTAVGEIFEDRKQLRASGIHAPTMAGIWGAQEGAYLSHPVR
jgi:hypothetical protein